MIGVILVNDMNLQKSTQHLRPFMMMLVAIIILVAFMCSLSLAIVAYDKQGSVVNSIKTGDAITILYSEGDTGINITNAVPMSDSTGMQLSGENETFHFNVSAKLNRATINYEIAAIKKSDSTLADDDVHIYLEKSINGGDYVATFGPSIFIPLKTASVLGSPEGSMIMEKGTFNASQTNDYILRMWLKDSYIVDPENSKFYTVTVNVYAGE